MLLPRIVKGLRNGSGKSEHARKRKTVPVRFPLGAHFPFLRKILDLF